MYKWWCVGGTFRGVAWGVERRGLASPHGLEQAPWKIGGILSWQAIRWEAYDLHAGISEHRDRHTAWRRRAAVARLQRLRSHLGAIQFHAGPALRAGLGRLRQHHRQECHAARESLRRNSAVFQWDHQQYFAG